MQSLFFMVFRHFDRAGSDRGVYSKISRVFLSLPSRTCEGIGRFCSSMRRSLEFRAVQVGFLGTHCRRRLKEPPLPSTPSAGHSWCRSIEMSRLPAERTRRPLLLQPSRKSLKKAKIRVRIRKRPCEYKLVADKRMSLLFFQIIYNLDVRIEESVKPMILA